MACPGTVTGMRQPTYDAELADWLDQRGLPHELIDGTVVVDPGEGLLHARLLMRLLTVLSTAAVPGTEVFTSRVPVSYCADDYVRPDLSVVRIADADIDDEGMRVPPLLVVEVLSPSTRRKDLLLKREIHAEFGVPSYWLVDPKTRILTVLSLRAGAYVETARGSRLELDEPFPVPIDLT